MDGGFILEMRNISKSFAGVKALQNVDFSCKKGEVHALVGENGAGKSTLLKILSGQLQADSGEILLNGKPVSFKNPRSAQKAGIAMVDQELKLFPDLKVYQNIFLNHEVRNRVGLVDIKKMRAETKQVFDEFDIHIDPDDTVRDLPIAKQQMVEIVKQLTLNPDIIIMDEPTSALAREEVGKLYEIIGKLTAGGKTVIFISHRLEEIFHICGRATVFKDGKFVKSVNIHEVTQDGLVTLMVGRPLLSLFPPKAETAADGNVLEVTGLNYGNKLKDISLEVKKGEIVGIAGLQGHGQTELLNCIAGIEKRNKGSIKINGNQVEINNPTEAIAAGIALIPEDRKTQGLCLSLTLRENLAAASMGLRSRLGFIRKRAEAAFVGETIESLSIKSRGAEIQVNTLSGGNQQKVVLGKEMAIEPKVLLLSEPTRGIDVETKSEFYKLMRSLADDGIAVVMYSSDLIELVGMSDKVAVMYEGRISALLKKDGIDDRNIMRAAVGMG